jgi:hypothetical protein
MQFPLRRSLAVLFLAGIPLLTMPRRTDAQSVAIEADALAYFLGGYSGIVNLTFDSGLSIALGAGRYNVPGFVVEGQETFEEAGWKATSESIQVLRIGYRLRGTGTNGPAVHAIVLNQNWRLEAERLGDETRFRPLGMGVSAGYYFHLGPHFYVYPTASATYTTVYSGETSVQGRDYDVAAWQINPSVHIGWEF